MADFRRFGRFTVPARLAHEFSTDLKRVMGLCIVFRAEHLFHCDQIEYWAASEHFRPVPLGEVTPEYRWVFEDGHPRAAEVTVTSGVGPAPQLAKHQPCGCVLCTCEDEDRCHGCGAKFCAEHDPRGVAPSHGETVRSQPPAPSVRMPLTLVDNEDRAGRIPGQPGYAGPGQ